MSDFERVVLLMDKSPASGWVKRYHSGIPDVEGEERKKARTDAVQQNHCEVCTVLSGCYFPSSNMPQYPQHPHCDCLLFSVGRPTRQAVADCAIEKFTGYVFIPEKSKGKTEIFKDWGYTVEDSERLKAEFERQARTKYLSGDYSLQVLNGYGQRITILIKLKKSDNSDIMFKTGWMVHPLGVITCTTPFSGEIK